MTISRKRDLHVGRGTYSADKLHEAFRYGDREKLVRISILLSIPT